MSRFTGQGSLCDGQTGIGKTRPAKKADRADRRRPDVSFRHFLKFTDIFSTSSPYESPAHKSLCSEKCGKHSA